MIAMRIGQAADHALSPRERARDEQPLDLARALVDLRDARVAVVPLDRVVREVAVAAMDLDRLGADPFGELGGEELRLRGLGQARQALASHPRRVQHQQARRVEPRLHVREHVADGCVLDQRFAELGPPASVSDGRLECRARDAERLRGDADATAFEVREGDRQSLAARPQQVVFGIAQLSRTIAQVSEARIPSLCSSFWGWNPGVSVGITKADNPFFPSSGSVTRRRARGARACRR
jgi:hypothetical protein